jgi:hypothetical protein
MNPASVDPIPVTIQGPVPIPVTMATPRGIGLQPQDTIPSLPAQTTFQEDLTTAGQRRINLIWEWTQAVIAIMVIGANMVVGIYQGLVMAENRPEYPIILSSSLFLIVGFYFSRTNHAAIGGIGQKPHTTYSGR